MKKFTFAPIAIFTLTMLLAGCSSNKPEPKILINGLELGPRCEAYCNERLEKNPYSTDIEACQLSCEVQAERNSF